MMIGAWKRQCSYSMVVQNWFNKFICRSEI